MAWPKALGGPILLLVFAGVYSVVAPNAYDLAVGVNIGVAAIAVMGLTMAVGGAGQLHLGQAGFMAIGAYTVAVLTREEILGFVPALLAGIVLASLAGFLVGYVALRLKGDYLAMATLATAMIIYALLLLDGPLGGPAGLAAIPPPAIGEIKFLRPMEQFFLVAVALAVVYFIAQLVRVTRFGRELRALRDDEVAARAVGVSITRRKIQIFALAAAFGGLAGGLMASLQSAIDPHSFGLHISIQLLVMAVIGGLGHPAGAILGAALLQYITQSIPSAGDISLMVVGGVVVVMMAVAPDGLFGVSSAISRLLGRLRNGMARTRGTTKGSAL